MQGLAQQSQEPSHCKSEGYNQGRGARRTSGIEARASPVALQSPLQSKIKGRRAKRRLLNRHRRCATGLKSALLANTCLVHLICRRVRLYAACGRLRIGTPPIDLIGRSLG